MKIAIDAFPLSLKTGSGIPNYVRNVLLNILGLDRLKTDGGNEYFLYCKNPFDKKFQESPNLHFRFSHSASEASTSYGNTLWLFSRGVRMMKEDKIDIFWGTRQMLPPYLPGRIKKVLVSYDLVWHYFPETMESYNRLVSKVLFRRSISKADHIITISEATKRSLMEVIGVPTERISVIYPAGSGYVRLDKEESARYISERYKTDKDYILAVSTVEPRKNLPSLLRAVAGLKGEGLQLLVAGASGWKTSAIYEEYDRLGLTEREVKFLGYVPDGEMNRLYSGARLFVFPSVYEGFGMPVLEAMASGTPVIVSNASSIPEAAGDAGILLDPHEVGGWREAILKVISDSGLREGMIERGLERARLFSWEKSARQTLEAFEKGATAP